MDTDTNTDAPAAPSSTALTYLTAATALAQVLATDTAAIASGVGSTKLASNITNALSTFQAVQGPVQELEQLAAGFFNFFVQIVHSHAASKTS